MKARISSVLGCLLAWGISVSSFLLAGQARAEEPLYYLEYLRTVNGSYFDTEYTPGPNTTVIMDMRMASYDVRPYFFGVATDAFSMNVQITGGGTYSCRCSDGYSKSYHYQLGKRDTDVHRIFELNGPDRYFYVMDLNDGVVTNSAMNLAGYAATQTATASLYLFALNDNGTAVVLNNGAPSQYKVYSVRIYEAGELVRDFRPCLSNDRKVCLYDVKNGKLYSGLGETDSIAGPPMGSVGDVYLSPIGGDDDDAPAIQAAINQLGKDTLYLNKGTYNIASPIKMRKGVTLAGVDRDACVLRLSGGVMKDFMLELQEKSAISNLTVTCSDPDSGLQDCWGAIHVKYEDDYADSVGVLENLLITGFYHRYNYSGHSSSTYYSGTQIRAEHAVAIRRCIVSNNTTKVNNGSFGGYPGIWVGSSSGKTLIENCEIRCNLGETTALATTVPLYVAEGTVRNCLIADNTIKGRALAVLAAGATKVVNCTIVNNKGLSPSAANYGGGACGLVDTVEFMNCLVAGNTTDGTEINFEQTSVAKQTTCATKTPVFVNAAEGDYRVKTGDTIDVGTNDSSWMNDATDLSGITARIVNDVVDIGCYEFVEMELICSIRTDADSALDRLETCLTADVKGPDKKGLVYSWALYDGKTWQYEDDPDRSFVNAVYSQAGIYTVALTVKNEAGDTASAPPLTISVYGSHVYLATTGESVSPYANWQTAATNVADVLPLLGDGSTLHVGLGEYVVESPMDLRKSITIKGEGASATDVVLKPASSGYQLVQVADAGVRLEALTFKGATPRAVQMTGGLVTNCVFCGNSGDTSTPVGDGGAALRLSGEVTVLDCLFTNNVMALSGGSVRHGGAIFADGSGWKVERCRFVGNCLGTKTTDQNGKFGMAIYATGAGCVRNCLFARQTTYYADRWSGTDTMTVGTLYANGAIEVSNCTFADNHADEGSCCPGLVTAESAIVGVTNCLFAANMNKDGASNVSLGSKTTFVNCRSVDTLSDFRRPDRGDYRLLRKSPAVDAGANADWMTNGVDVFGLRRIVGGIVDIGCCENPQSGLMILFR